jgi:hypothetical protein
VGCTAREELKEQWSRRWEGGREELRLSEAAGGQGRGASASAGWLQLRVGEEKRS